MKQSGLLFSVVALVAFGSSARVNAAEVREHYKKSYDLRMGGKVTVENINGFVHIETWNKDKVEVKALKKVKARSKRDAENFMRRVKLKTTRNRNRITIKTEYPQHSGDSGFFSWMVGRRKPEVTVEYSLKVPKEADVDVTTVNGEISAEDVEGEADLSTTNGHVEAVDISGSLKAQTVNGGIKVDISYLDRRDVIRLKTVNGTIVAHFPADMNADVKASTVNGGIRSDFSLDVHGKWGPKKVSGVVGQGGANVNIATVNGGIKILER